MRDAKILVTSLVALTIATPSRARAGESDHLFAAPSGPYVAPGRLFEVTLPGGWVSYEVPKDPNTVEFRAPQLPGDAVLVVRRLNVPKGANPRQILLKAIESRISKLPNVRIVHRRTLTVGRAPAASVLATYSYQGNIQYPRVLEELVLVSGTDGYFMHFECFEPAASAYADDLNSFYETFAPRPAGGMQHAPFEPIPEAPVKKIEF